MASTARIGPELFEFLAELRDNNSREWFEANRSRYEAHVREPLLAFVADFAAPLREISPNFVADPRPAGGSMFRIYRDVRFSRDKTPYKTQAALSFRHNVGREVHGPGFYLHLEPGNVFGGVGIWHPDSRTLGKVRDAIVANPGRWERIQGDPAFRDRYSLEGDSLKRPPRGYDPDHPLIDDLKRKDFVATTYLDEDQARASDFVDRFATVCREAAPFAEFLTTAVGLPW